MCAILAMTIDGSKFDDNKGIIETTIDHLNLKGRDYFNGVVVAKRYNKITHYTVSAKTIHHFKEQVFDLIDLFSVSSDVGVLLFSRATPEMEQENAKELQPYSLSKIENTWIAAHGTLPDADDIAGTKLNIDTEVYKYVEQRVVHTETKGKVVSFKLSVNNSIEIDIFNNGLGYWTFKRPGLNIVANYNVKNEFMLQTERIDHISDSVDCFGQTIIGNVKQPVDEVFVSFSGGMDIVASVMYYLKNTVTFLPKHLTLVYFDYGQVARKQELKSLRQFKDYLIGQFPTIQIHTKVLHVSELFGIYGKTKLTNSNAKGDVKETEQSVAYVNFRNTQFATILAGYAEKVIMAKYNNAIPVDLIFGLNLSEGMIMSDNTYAWLESMNKSIKFGGDFSSNFNLVAPFVNHTKTEIAQFMNRFDDELYNISYSCYYPKPNGEPCGECGSCILREKAKARSRKSTIRKG